MAGQRFDGLNVALRKLRERKGWTLARAGSKAHVDMGNLSRYESGDVCPTLAVLSRLLDAYGTSLHGLADLLESPLVPAGRAEGSPADPFLDAVAAALERLGYGSPAGDEEPGEGQPGPRLLRRSGTRA